MIVKIDSEGQVALPERLMGVLEVKPGDHLEVDVGYDWFILRRCDPERLKQRNRKVDLSQPAPLHGKIDPNHEPFDIEDLEEVRKHMYVGSPLRD